MSVTRQVDHFRWKWVGKEEEKGGLMFGFVAAPTGDATPRLSV